MSIGMGSPPSPGVGSSKNVPAVGGGSAGKRGGTMTGMTGTGKNRQETGTGGGGKRGGEERVMCSACIQHDTASDIVDKYCQADFGMRKKESINVAAM